uniref:Uncharacterized protein n=1 Tax=Chenopodium quinoa TaxID=63459 RepID=A0A803LRL7_CHEQI
MCAEIGILRAAINFPEGNLLSLNEDLKLLRSETVDLFGLSDKVDQRIQGIEENFLKLKQEFEQFRQIMVLRLNAMAVDAINNEDLLNFYINNFNQSVPTIKDAALDYIVGAETELLHGGEGEIGVIQIGLIQVVGVAVMVRQHDFPETVIYFNVRVLMTRLITGSQSSLLLPQLQPHATLPGSGLLSVKYGGTSVSSCYKLHLSSTAKSRICQHPLTSSSFSQLNTRLQRGIIATAVSSTSSLDFESPSDEGSDDADAKKSKGLSMSQKLTLAYAALVGLGGLMGYLKSGSQKSLASGGLSALLLYYVYTELPKRPVFASSVGLGLSAALLVVMGSRFKKSGKVFPAGVVSLVSLIMTGGYAHGVMRSSH